MDRREILKISGAATVAGVLVCPTFATPARSPVYSDLVRNLGAPGRSRLAGNDEQAAAFDQFVGTWDVSYTNIADDGSSETLPGQLIVGWILDGRALQDIWIQASANPNDPPFKGTTIRFYDPVKKIWRVTWVSAAAQAQLLLEGRRTGSTIDLWAETPKGRVKWTFYDIERDRFRWRNEHSSDNGKTWRLKESHVMRRVTST